ncbi:MAG TPA: type I methionyl aminopeptidase [Polyangiaceae bacterium LLY-WYZ-15_(1-7)]|nr:type I methionyl aminopeptidase [Polyangiaceae bacterium LLY-WYZ-15_(1-7)]HJL01249.1 type I methionyl aminopeptidase [Polyangiaceae bacterium LLY-WYZ-15_(1-7)]HJL39354.1 type I methionyl aminopeptidase [Polyangiaceae bacterium LLY-WYZ-15_(1-7)]
MSPRTVDQMRASCQLAAKTLVMVGEHLKAGMKTEEIDALVHEFIESHDAYPSPLNYRGFPKSVCTSVNDCVCHGIPGDQVLKDGDIINVDVTTYFPKKHGFHGDTSVTFYIGEPSEEAKLVTETARQALEIGIQQVRHGGRLWDIGAAIQEYAEGRGCSVVRDYVGHGVGREFHMPPQVPHYKPERQKGFFTDLKNHRMKEGMVFTIEPMINVGTYECELQDDDWTVLTKDRKLSAQFEHTILVTRTGAEVLTRRPAVVKHSEDLPWAEVGELSAPAAWEARQAAEAAG